MLWLRLYPSDTWNHKQSQRAQQQTTSTNIHLFTLTPLSPVTIHMTHYSHCFSQSKEVPHQYHMTSGDVHIGRHRLFTPWGCAAASWRAGCRPITELGWHTVEPRVAQGLWTFNTLRRPNCHSLATQLLGNYRRGWWSTGSSKTFFPPWLSMRDFMYLSSFMHITIVFCMWCAYPCC